MCGFSILISFASCDDFLDRDPSDRITEEEVFQKIQTAEEYLNNAYTFFTGLPNLYRRFGRTL